MDRGYHPVARRGRRCRALALAGVFLLFAPPANVPARAAEQVRIGIGYGLAFLPAYICEDLNLVEKRAKAQHLDLKVVYQRFAGAGPMADAIASRAIDIAPYGIAPLLQAWDKGGRRQIVAVSGLTTLPLTLLSERPALRAFADLRPADRIAVPTRSSPQAFLLQMQAEKAFGQYDRLAGAIVALPHAAAISALFSADRSLAAYFASPPYTQIALKDGKIHPILTSEEVVGGKASLLVLGAERTYLARHRQIAQIVAQAVDDAAALIGDDPSRAARIFLTHEPSKALRAADVAAVLRQNKDQFGSPVAGIGAFAAFMARHGALKQAPKSWKDVVAPALLRSPST